MFEKALHRVFNFGEKIGVHIIPDHFYYPVPNTNALDMDLWLDTDAEIGIDFRDKQQLWLLANFSKKYVAEYGGIPYSKTKVAYQYYFNNHFFGPVDAEILYCMIREYKPKRIVEVGSGFSTYLIAQAVNKNKMSDGISCDFSAIDPYANVVVKNGFPGLTQLVNGKIQEIEPEFFRNLESKDILFIDSSHILDIGSDVQFIFKKILPCLKKGVIVQLHDIFLPFEYPKNWVMKKHWFWNEQYILRAFLYGNSHYHILWAGCYMHYHYFNELKNVFKYESKNRIPPGSFWIRKISDR